MGLIEQKQVIEIEFMLRNEPLRDCEKQALRAYINSIKIKQKPNKDGKSRRK